MPPAGMFVGYRALELVCARIAGIRNDARDARRDRDCARGHRRLREEATGVLFECGAIPIAEISGCCGILTCCWMRPLPAPSGLAKRSPAAG
jgi:hypothetical protein